MKKIRYRIISIFLCLMMILTSVNISNIFENILKAEENSWQFNYNGSTQSFTAPKTGRYYIECFGASGGNNITDSRNCGWGGKTTGFINLLEGETIYITVGSAGSISGKGGYNGGGNAANGAGSGGGATSITTTNRGVLTNYKDYKNEVLMVAAGGGGQGTNPYVIYINNTTSGMGGGLTGCARYWFSTDFGVANQTSGYAFGKGQDYCSVYNNGYGGAGGGGWYGGYYSNHGYDGGGGGSSYINSKFKTTTNTQGINKGNGKVTISYDGEIYSTLTINPGGGGTLNGSTDVLILTNKYGTTVNLPELKIKDEYTFVKWEIEEGNIDMNNSTYTFGMEDAAVKAVYSVSLNLRSIADTSLFNGEGGVSLLFTQEENTGKSYKMFQSKDNVTWEQTFANTKGVDELTRTFNYTGRVEEYKAPCDGTYKLELYGAAGGGGTYGGYGGKTTGYIDLKKGDILYIAVGGAGTSASSGTTKGGWNGGGGGGQGCYSINEQTRYGTGTSGGGATSITTTNRGVLSNFANYKSEVIAVAGGGGGGYYWGRGGHGGGASGNYGSIGTSGNEIAPGTQTSGYSFGLGQTGASLGTFDTCPARGAEGRCGGGGGWYGGRAYTSSSYAFDSDAGGGGGSGYVNTSYLKSTKMENGINSKAGYVVISLSDQLIACDQLNDVYAPDIAAPDAPNNGSIISTEGTLKAVWDIPKDNGTTYYHKVSSYNENEELLETTDVVEDYIETGLKGYYYYIDTNSTGTVNSTHNYSKENNIEIQIENVVRYMHIAAIDNAGNISETYSFKLPSIANYTVEHYQMEIGGESYVLYETEIGSGPVGAEVYPAPKNYKGFTIPASQSIIVKEDNNSVIKYYYKRNQYNVNYIDVVDNENGEELNKITEKLYYGEYADAAKLGTDKSDNKYYKGYYLLSYTSGNVEDTDLNVYRIFKLRTINITGTVTWDDNSNKHKTRPSEVTISLITNDKVVNQTKGLAINDVNKYEFKNIPKYDLKTGDILEYKVSQSNVESLTNPEDTYETTQDNYDFINELNNYNVEEPDGPDVPPEEKNSYEISGQINWVDNNNYFNRRPYEVELILYQNGIEYERGMFDINLNENSSNYYFTNLPKYDNNKELYTYTVKQEFTKKVLTWDETLKKYKEIDAYTTSQEEYVITNTLVDTDDAPIIEIKPEYVNNLKIQLEFKNINWDKIGKTINNTKVNISFIQLEKITDEYIYYSNKYNGMKYNTIASRNITHINNIQEGKYEIFVAEDEFVLENIIISDETGMSIIIENNKYYLIVDSLNQNKSGTIKIILTAKDNYNYKTKTTINNLYK